MKISKWPLLLGILSLLGTIAVLPQLPDQIVTHWGINGEPDATGGKITQVFLATLPILLYALFAILPKIDPKRKNYELHQKAYRIFSDMMAVFLVALNWLSIGYNMGFPIDVRVSVTILTGVLFTVIGNYMGQIRHNYFFGIKTPWTLASENVWKKTHRLGGRLFAACGILTIISAFFPGVASFAVMMVSLLASTIVAAVYSYKEYKKEDASAR